MSKHQSYTDDSQGDANLEALAYLQKNWGRTEIANALRVTSKAVLNAVTGVAIAVPQGATIVDAHVICTTSVGSGSMQVKDGDSNAVTDAMACTTANALARAATMVPAYQVVTDAGIIVVSNANADRGTVYITYHM
jgi:hypothetical protein